MAYESFKLFDLQAEKVVKALRVADCMNFEDYFKEDREKDENSVLYNLKELAVSDVLTCSYCNISFADALDQRNHYKLDWHRYNIKRALSGNKSVPEEVFDTLADDISSISGSDNETSGNDTEDNEYTKPIQSLEQEKINCNFKKIRHAKMFFENDENKILSVYKCLLHNKKENPGKDELVKSVTELIQKPQKWIIILLGGGHFASGIFDKGEIVNHKTFHCYTVRAKQGGSQSSRDNKGGGHPKSAGASLRRYNEQALIQHVQEVLGTWSETIKQCSLILYRATGPYNRGVLFGGKNPALTKTDPRLRNIPFPTRRATFKEVRRVFDMLSSIEIYGSANDFKDKFPRSPDKRIKSPKNKTEETTGLIEEDQKAILKSKKIFRKCKEKSSPQREVLICPVSSSESESEDQSDMGLVSQEITVSFGELQEFEDTVPQHIKLLKNKVQKEMKRIKKSSQQKSKPQKKKFNSEAEKIRESLVKSCLNMDKELLIKTLNIYDKLPEKGSTEPSNSFTKEDFIECLRTPVDKESKNTVLHLAAQKCLPEFIELLLSAGADPTVRNKNKLTPYVIGDKNTRDSFRLFAASFPDKYDFRNANIPEPLSEELAKELEEKKKERKKLKRMKEKIKKQEDREKRHEEKEREKFLALSDREKCALAAERRLIASSTANLKSAKPVVLSRCFQCAADLTECFGPYGCLQCTFNPVEVSKNCIDIQNFSLSVPRKDNFIIDDFLQCPGENQSPTPDKLGEGKEEED